MTLGNLHVKKYVTLNIQFIELRVQVPFVKIVVSFHANKVKFYILLVIYIFSKLLILIWKYGNIPFSSYLLLVSRSQLLHLRKKCSSQYLMS